MEYHDYYKTLGVAKTATTDEIKRAYRKLARKYHPDVSKEKDAEAKFKEIAEAYEVLKDQDKRQKYDQLGSNWQQYARQGSGGFHKSGQGPEFTSGFSDFFESIFGSGFGVGAASHRGFDPRATHGFSQKGENTEAKIKIDLRDSYFGIKRQFKVQIPENMPDGRTYVKNKTLQVKIPKGILSGQKIRLGKQGNPGIGGGPSGDMLLQVEFAADKDFKADGGDIYASLNLSPWEAALGAEVSVPTLDGRVEIKVPANTRGGQKIRLKGKGLPAKTPGDLYFTAKIMNPVQLTGEEKGLYRKLKDISEFNPRG